MKKSPLRYLLTVFLLFIFTAGTITPYFTGIAKYKEGFSIGNEKTEKENREKDFAGETALSEYFTNVLHQLHESLRLSLMKTVYADMEVSFLQSCYIPVLTPPPDHV